MERYRSVPGGSHLAGRARRHLALAVSACLMATAGTLSLPFTGGALIAQAAQTGSKANPNLFDQASQATTAPRNQPINPTIGIQPAASAIASSTTPGVPSPRLRAAAQMSMAPASFSINPVTPSHFLGSDGRLEIDVPSSALNAADVTADGGSTSLLVTQILPMSGSNAGGSGHFSFGTYMIQVLDANGNVAKHGLRSPVTLKFHYGSQDSALDLAHSYVVLNGAFPTDMNVAPGWLVTGSPTKQAATLKALSATSALGPLVTLSPTYDATTQTLSAPAPLATPSTSSSFGTNSSVATFGKPQPFEAGLSGASLTAGYPIDLPAGPKGFKPALTLSYNSAGVNDQHNAQGAAGWVGEGWNLSLGAISWAEHYVADGGSTNSLRFQFQGDYNTLISDNAHAWFIWTDGRNAATCEAVDAFRAGTASKPSVPDSCPDNFGNTDIVVGQVTL